MIASLCTKSTIDVVIGPLVGDDLLDHVLVRVAILCLVGQSV